MRVVIALLLVVLSSPRARGEELSQKLAATLTATLIDERGREVHFYDDLVHGRVIAVNFIFTSCTTVCQPMSATFAQAEAQLGHRSARLVSISIDPEMDTPARLATWKKRFHGGDAWTLLTGSRAQIDALRKALGVYTPDRFSHSPTVVVIDDLHGRTTRLNGFASATAIVGMIDTASK
jgi:cytochrome oxidase Cu insertion factor (SCO1/SenC/PrrC family)